MIRCRTQIRDAIIPDASVRLLSLCLSDDENGIVVPITQRKSKCLDFRAYWALQSVIKERIENKAIPLVLRKRQLYENATKKEPESNSKLYVNELLALNAVPIFMRKHLLYQDCRAG